MAATMKALTSSREALKRKSWHGGSASIPVPRRAHPELVGTRASCHGIFAELQQLREDIDRLSAARDPRLAEFARKAAHDAWTAKVPAEQARFELIHACAQAQAGRHDQATFELTRLIRSHRFQLLSHRARLRAISSLGWLRTIADPSDGVDACVEMIRRACPDADHSPTLSALEFVATAGLCRYLWSSPDFKTLLIAQGFAGARRQHWLAQASAACAQAAVQAQPCATTGGAPGGAFVIRSIGNICCALMRGNVGAIVEVLEELKKAGSSVEHCAELKVRYLSAGALLLLDRGQMACAAIGPAPNLLHLAGTWDYHLLWQHLRSLIAQRNGEPQRAFELYEDYVAEAAKRALSMHFGAQEFHLPTDPSQRNGVRPSAGALPQHLQMAVHILQDDSRWRSVGKLAALVGVSPAMLKRDFTRHFGLGPKEYLEQINLDAARQWLIASSDGPCTIKQLSARFGFGHAGRFAALYRSRFGCAPSEDRRISALRSRATGGAWAPQPRGSV
jgi:AraC-like DNA-binding protein